MSDDRDPLPSSLSEERTQPVGFVDANYILWRVFERDARNDPGRRAEHCLIFSCPDAVRRVWKYPEAWRSLSDAELEALSWQL
jgi:hypothetical protein